MLRFQVLLAQSSTSSEGLMPRIIFASSQLIINGCFMCLALIQHNSFSESKDKNVVTFSLPEKKIKIIT